MRPHRQQPTRLPHSWDSRSKNTGVGCHFLLQGMKVKSESEVTQSCLTPSDPMDCSLSGSSIHEIFQARVLEWVAIAFSNCYLKMTTINTLAYSSRHLIYAYVHIFPFKSHYSFFKKNLQCTQCIYSMPSSNLSYIIIDVCYFTIRMIHSLCN